MCDLAGPCQVLVSGAIPSLVVGSGSSSKTAETTNSKEFPGYGGSIGPFPDRRLGEPVPRSADGTDLACHVSGNGPIDLVFIHGCGIPIDALSEDLGFNRTVAFDAGVVAIGRRI